ncbi:GNAT family N-acetyltransferase [Methylophilus sp. 5]|uniref:GNAT family N-acetyltransferase n=1 Tax=Methylophilus sp. 5 TaxID=1112274 RepID=UPI00048FE9C2|nr:GNAT family N-acetyltransferase [Methylophilus sp. 5]
MHEDTSIQIRPLEPQDYECWCQLYAAYAAFYGVTQTQAMRDQVWQWIQQSPPVISALVAVSANNHLLGFLHYRLFVRPLAAALGAYVDDVFVLPEARGQGVAQQLIATVAQIGQENHWTVIRWMTAKDNLPARACYDKVAEHTHWQTYEIKLPKTR